MLVVDSVPLMVCRAAKVTVVVPAVDVALTDRLLKVFASWITCVAPEPVNEKL